MKDEFQPLRQQVEQTFDSLDPEKVRLVATSRNLRAIVDARYFNEIDKYRWYAVVSHSGYVSVAADVKGSRISMQRLVLSLETGRPFKEIKQVTFANKLTFDCRVENLVPKTGRTSVMRNRRPKRNTTSVFKGVRRKERTNGGHYWAAQIKGSIGNVNLGQYDTEREAALVYDAAAHMLFEGSAFYNFPDLAPDPDALVLAGDRIERFKNIKARRSNGT